MSVAAMKNRPGPTMSIEGYPGLLSLILSDSDRVSGGQRVRWTVASLVFHLCLLTLVALVAGLRFSKTGERPLASYQVSLVSLPAPSRVVEPPPAPPVTKASPPVALAAKPLPSKPVPATPPKRMELPARAVKVEPAPQNLRKEIDSLLDSLKVPDVPSPPKESLQEVQERQPRPSVSKEIDKELQKHQQPTVAPAVAAKVPDLKKPEAVIKVPGMASGFNQYLSRVQLKISSLWIAPPGDLTGQALEVIIKFRLHRSGTVSDVTIERTSGNEYYDLAGKRAVLNADPLPAFPREMADTYLDAHFSFTVGERSS